MESTDASRKLPLVPGGAEPSVIPRLSFGIFTICGIKDFQVARGFAQSRFPECLLEQVERSGWRRPRGTQTRKVAASGIRKGQVPQDGPGRAQQAKNREIGDFIWRNLSYNDNHILIWQDLHVN